jgi:RNA polymerase sigma factor for flagellar operon FliA
MSDEELRRWRTWRDRRRSAKEREAVRQSLLNDHLPLVRAVVSQMATAFPSATVEFADMLQCGVIGLMSALERFDPDYGVEFRSYASRRIRGQVLDEFRKLDWIPRSVRRQGKPVPALQSLEDLASRREAGLGSSLLDSAPRQEPEQEMDLERLDDLALLERSLARLMPRDRRVLSLYYFEKKNLRQIALLFSLTESRICQIHASALLKLRGQALRLAA